MNLTITKFDKPADTQITFSDPILYTLWREELSGQISDGAWENSANTEWLWKSDVKMGTENSVKVLRSYNIGRKSFPFWNELVVKYPDCDLSDRMIEAVKEKVGVEITKNDLKKYLDQITQMIKNVEEDASIYDAQVNFSKEYEKSFKERYEYATKVLSGKGYNLELFCGSQYVEKDVELVDFRLSSEGKEQFTFRKRYDNSKYPTSYYVGESDLDTFITAFKTVTAFTK